MDDLVRQGLLDPNGQPEEGSPSDEAAPPTEFVASPR